MDERLKEIIKYQVEAYGGKLNPKDDFDGFIFDIKNAIKEAGYIKRGEIKVDEEKIRGI